jgi:hypothetical protein
MNTVQSKYFKKQGFLKRKFQKTSQPNGEILFSTNNKVVYYLPFFLSKMSALGSALTRCKKNLKEGETKGFVSQVWERMAGLSIQEYLTTVTPWTEVICILLV